MIEENIDLPFRARVIGEEVEVVAFEWPEERHGLYVVYERSGKRHRVDAIRWSGSNSLEGIRMDRRLQAMAQGRD